MPRSGSRGGLVALFQRVHDRGQVLIHERIF